MISDQQSPMIRQRPTQVQNVDCNREMQEMNERTAANVNCKTFPVRVCDCDIVNDADVCQRCKGVGRRSLADADEGRCVG